MMLRRDFLHLMVATGAFFRKGLSLVSRSPTPLPEAEATPYVPPWHSLLKQNRVQPVVATVRDTPIHGFGDVDILAVAPDLAPGEILQEGNSLPTTKIRPKKSWEIKSNKIGATPPRTPRTYMMDFKPLRAVHLIDGDPETYWACRGQTRPDVQPQWVRIDLPRETRVRAVRILPRQDCRGWPEELTVKVSRDAWRWETVYENRSFEAPPDPSPRTFSFEPRPVKQVWIVANKLRWAIQPVFLVFSIAGVEVLDENGDNVALASRGAGVTVSSTNHGAAGEKTLHDMLWPVHYDLGLKWVRVAYWDSVLNWHYAEQEKGKIVIDPLADQTVSETADNGVNVVLCLAYGNWLYSRQGGRKQGKEVWVVPFEWPPPPTDTEEHFQAWLRFVRTMVRHFKGRIRYYEIWNEPNANWRAAYNQSSKTPEAIREYCRLVKESVRVIREEYAEAKILLASTGGFDREYLTACLRQGVGPLVDVIAWHPFYGTPQDLPNYRHYRADVKAWKEVCESHGFKGEYMATESGYYAPYPAPEKPFAGGAVSEIAKAKSLSRYIAMSVGLDLTTFWNTTWHHYIYWDLGLFRNSFSADPVSPTHPQAAYYVLRTLCTVLDSATPASVAVEFSNTQTEFEVEAFRLPGGALLVGLWVPGQVLDESPRIKTNLRFPELRFGQATGIDVLNGTEQPLQVSDSELRGVNVKDYPIFLRFTVRFRQACVVGQPSPDMELAAVAEAASASW